MVLLLGWHHGADMLALFLVGICLASVVSIVVAAQEVGRTISITDFALVRYTFSYVMALQLGLRLSRRQVQGPNLIALLSLVGLVSLAVAAAASPELRRAIEEVYGVIGYAQIELRLRLIDINPLVLGYTATLLYLVASRGRRFYVRCVLFGAALLPIYFTQQRTASILLVSLFALSEFVLVRKRVGLPLFVMCLVIVAGFWVVGTYDHSGYGERYTAERQADGVAARVAIYESVWSEVLRHPVVGLGRSTEEMDTYGLSAGADGGGLGLQPHSEYLGIIYQFGLLGLLPFALLVRRLLLSAYAAWRVRGKDPVGRALVAFVGVYMLSMFVWESLYFPLWSVFLFVYMGVLVQVYAIPASIGDCKH